MKKPIGVRIIFPVVLVLLLLIILGAVLYSTGIINANRLNSSRLFFNGKIALVPLAGVEQSEVSHVKAQVERFYGFDVTVLDRKEMPQNSYYQPRNRYKAKLVLDYLKTMKPVEYDKVIALTDRDISTSVHGHEDWGIIGLAYLDKESCIVSTYRLGKGKVREKRFYDRLTKASLHEVGHTLGLPHCTTAFCFMVDAGGRVATIDKAEVALCSSCKKSSTFLAYKRAAFFSTTVSAL